MSGAFLLYAHTLKRARGLIIATGSLLALFQAVMILVARSIQQNGSFEQLGVLLPPFVRELMGPAVAGFLSFGGIVSLGYFHIAVLGTVIAFSVSLATIPVSEMETGFLELIMARPIARHWIVTRVIAVLLSTTALVMTAMVAATLLSLKAFAPAGVTRPSPYLIGSLALNLGALMLCWGGVALAIGCGSRRRGVAGGISGFLALTAFLLDYVGRLWGPVEKVAWLSPFRYYDPLPMIMGAALPLKNLAVLTTIVVAGFAVSYVLIARRDLQR